MAWDISASTLVPPSITYTKINTYVKSDKGLAKRIDVTPATSLQRWVTRSK